MKGKYVVKQQQVALTLWNPTNEMLEMQYAGVSMSMEPGERETFDITCAKHLLNTHGQRGLTSLNYGITKEEEERIGKEAIERNLSFKRKQITDYNVRNENRKNMGLGYLTPGKKMREYALELGIELMEPYAPRDAERVRINEMTTRNVELETMVAEMMKQVNALTEEVRKSKGK